MHGPDDWGPRGGPRGGPRDDFHREARPRDEPNEKRDKSRRKPFDEKDAVKVRGKFTSGFGRDPETALKKAMAWVGGWIVAETGSMTGLVRAEIVNGDGKRITYDLSSMDAGVVKEGKFGTTEDPVDFRLMCVCGKADQDELRQELTDVIDRCGLEHTWTEGSEDDDWDDDGDSEDDEWSD